MHVNPPDWPTVTQDQWDTFLETINWKRDGYGGGVYYSFRDARGRFGFMADNGKTYINPKFILNRDGD